jgi:hypothetical protein
VVLLILMRKLWLAAWDTLRDTLFRACVQADHAVSTLAALEAQFQAGDKRQMPFSTTISAMLGCAHALPHAHVWFKHCLHVWLYVWLKQHFHAWFCVWLKRH